MCLKKTIISRGITLYLFDIKHNTIKAITFSDFYTTFCLKDFLWVPCNSRITNSMYCTYKQQDDSLSVPPNKRRYNDNSLKFMMKTVYSYSVNRQLWYQERVKCLFNWQSFKKKDAAKLLNMTPWVSIAWKLHKSQAKRRLTFSYWNKLNKLYWCCYFYSWSINKFSFGLTQKKTSWDW